MALESLWPLSLRNATLALLLLLPPCTLAAQTQVPTGAPGDQGSVAVQPMQELSGPVEPPLQEMRAMSAEQLDELGDRMRQARNYLAANDCYREALRKHSSAAYYNKLAISELMMRHPKEAVAAAKHAVHKDHKMAEAWNNMGVAYYMMNRFEDAIHNYEKAISIEPDSASFHNNLAAVLADDKQLERALGEYRKAFEIDPEFFERASRTGISAHMNSPRDRAQFSFMLARLFAAQGDLDRALHFLRAAIEDGYPKIDDVYHEKEFAQAITDERFVTLLRDRPVAIR